MKRRPQPFQNPCSIEASLNATITIIIILVMAMMERSPMTTLSSCRPMIEALEEEDGGEGLDGLGGGEGLEGAGGGVSIIVLDVEDLPELVIEAVAADDGTTATEHAARKGNVDSSGSAGLPFLFSCACG